MLKKNKLLTLVIIATTIIFSLLIKNYNINILILLSKNSSDIGVHFNLLTVTSIIGGFMFSGLGLLVGLSGNNIVRELDRAEVLDKIYNNILCGILFCFLSILATLGMIFSVFEFSQKARWIIASSEVIFLANGLVCFLFSVIDLKFIINAIHERNKNIPDNVMNEIRKSANTSESKKKTLKQIKLIVVFVIVFLLGYVVLNNIPRLF